MEKFDFEKAVKELLAGKKIGGKDVVLAPLVKELIEAALEVEIESHIADEVLQGKRNRRNVKTEKQLNPQAGNLNLLPRDTEKKALSSLRSSDELQIVKKY